jgi:hypothetical protein
MALPASIRAVIGARVGRLGPDAERVLSLAAVIGRAFDLDVLAASQTSEDQPLDTRRCRWAARSASSPTHWAIHPPTPSSNTPLQDSLTGGPGAPSSR